MPVLLVYEFRHETMVVKVFLFDEPRPVDLGMLPREHFFSPQITENFSRVPHQIRRDFLNRIYNGTLDRPHDHEFIQISLENLGRGSSLLSILPLSDFEWGVCFSI